MASKIQRELALLLTGKDISASRAVKGVNSELKKLNQVGRNAGTAVARNLERGAIIGAGAATAAIGYAVNQAMDFEAHLNTINTIAREDAEGLAAIGQTIRQESRESGVAVEDLATAYYDLLSAGIKTADAQKTLHAANTLAIGGLSTTAEAVDLLTSAINAYGGDASKGAQFADEFAKAIERGKVTAAELAASYASVAPLANSLNIENAELAAGYARLTAGGTAAGEAATQMASAMTALLKMTPQLKALQKATGKNYAAIAGSKGLNVALQQMRDDAEKAGVPLVELLGRKEALLYILASTGENLDEYNADLAAMGDAAGTAAGQMGERQQGLAFQLKKLKANVNDAAITIGSKLLPILGELAEDATGWIMAHQDDIEQFGTDLADGIRDAVEWARKLDWENIGKGLSIAADAGKALIGAFTNAPPWLQGFLITGFVANKFTGGAVKDIAGILLGQVVKGVLGMNAGVVTINAGVVNGGGMGAGGAAGAVKGGLGTLSRVFLVGEAIGLAVAVEATRQAIAAQSTEHARTIQTQTDRWLAQSPTREQLVNGLGGVRQGIRDLQSNPLLTLVQGEALSSLQAMEGDIAAQIARIDALRDQANRTKDDTVEATERVKRASLETKRETTRGLALVNQTTRSSARTSAASISSAIRSSKPNIRTEVNVYVTGGSVKRETNVQESYGPGSGSAGTGHAPGTGPLP